MEENPCTPMYAWFMRYHDQLSKTAEEDFKKAIQDTYLRAQDECAYASAQVENDYDGWVSPDELKEYYVAKPLDRGGFPIHDVELVLPIAYITGAVNDPR